MAQVPVDSNVVASCRALAGRIADDVQRFIDGHTTVGVERTTARAYGVDGVDDQGTPLVNLLVDRCHQQGLVSRGIAFFLGRALAGGARSINEAAERLAFAPDWARVQAASGGAREALERYTKAALDGIDAAKQAREAKKAKFAPPSTPLKYVIVATGNIY